MVSPFPHLIPVSAKASPSAERSHTQLSPGLQNGVVPLCISLQAHSALVGKTSRLCPGFKCGGGGAVCFLSCEADRRTYVGADSDRPKAAKFSLPSGARL